MYRNIFSKIVGFDGDVVSTVDHPYTSPPTHIFDAHANLLQKYDHKVMVMNWDVSLPGVRTYRYDLCTDTGLVAKFPLLFQYRSDDLYCNQFLKKLPVSTFGQCVIIALQIVQNKYSLSPEKINSLRHYCEHIIRIVKLSYTPAPWQYTKNLLERYYRYVGREDMAIFIHNQYSNYWLSDIMKKWIPWCITNIHGELSIDNLINEGVFLRAPFRININTITTVDMEHQDQLTTLINNGAVIPSLDVFLWSLFIADIRHYGNDFGFFSRLARAVNNPEITHHQITAPGIDAVNIISLDRDYAVLLEKNSDGGIAPSPRPYNGSKSTRINSLFAATVLGGNIATDFLQQYRHGQKPITISL